MRSLSVAARRCGGAPRQAYGSPDAENPLPHHLRRKRINSPTIARQRRRSMPCNRRSAPVGGAQIRKNRVAIVNE
jgi:hypothetical protein